MLLHPPAQSGIDELTSEKIRDFVLQDFQSRKEQEIVPAFGPDRFWQGLRDLGTELWLDTGDVDAACDLWCEQFSALTTNNTLLNREVQKGIYDNLIKQADTLLKGLSVEERIVEIAFILNTRHALRLVRQFNAKVSVELHTDLANDIERTISYARRIYAIHPENFIIKVPFTPEGLIATRTLRELGIPINMTLGFSVRHNVLAAAAARPDYVNVFLGRINSYISQNKLGTGKMVGEKTTLASMRAVKAMSKSNPFPTRQIAASMRDTQQVKNLAGVDVMTMPVKVAAGAKKQLKRSWTSRVDDDYDIALDPGQDPHEVRIHTCWELSDNVNALADELHRSIPENSAELIQKFREYGIYDIFPATTDKELANIRKNGKIPDHAVWKASIREKQMAVDSLLNIAGIESFSLDQEKLDKRIANIIGV